MDHRHTFLTTQGHGGPPRMSDQSYAEATSETAQTWKTIHTKHTLSHSNKANMEWWLRRPNDIRGPWGPKVSWHLSYRWGKTPKKTSPRKPVPTGDRTRARRVTSAHATTCSTAVDKPNYNNSNVLVSLFLTNITYVIVLWRCIS